MHNNEHYFSKFQDFDGNYIIFIKDIFIRKPHALKRLLIYENIIYPFSKIQDSVFQITRYTEKHFLSFQTQNVIPFKDKKY